MFPSWDSIAGSLPLEAVLLRECLHLTLALAMPMERTPTRNVVSGEAVTVNEVSGGGAHEGRADEVPSAVVMPASAVAAMEEEHEVLHASIRAASVAQVVIAIVAVLGLFYLAKSAGNHLHVSVDRLYSGAASEFPEPQENSPAGGRIAGGGPAASPVGRVQLLLLQPCIGICG